MRLREVTYILLEVSIVQLLSGPFQGTLFEEPPKFLFGDSQALRPVRDLDAGQSHQVELLTVNILMKADARHVNDLLFQLAGAHLARLLFYGLFEADLELRFLVERFKFGVWHKKHLDLAKAVHQKFLPLFMLSPSGLQWLILMYLKWVHATTCDSLMLLRTPPILYLSPRASVHHFLCRFAYPGAAQTSVNI